MIWKALDAEGLNPEKAFESAGIDYRQMSNPGSRYSFSKMTQLWAAASEASSSECFGLVAAEYWHPTTFQALGIAWLASHTLQEAFERLVRHVDMISTAAEARLTRDDDGFHLTLRVSGSETDAHPEAVTATLATLVHMCRQSMGKDFSPRLVKTPSTKPGCDKALRQFFNCDIEYDSALIGLTFLAEDMQAQLPTGNQELLLSTEKIIADYLKSLGKNDILSDARVEIIKQLPSGQLTDDSLAEALHMSTRTLQRRLKDKAIGYRDLLESVRQELADLYINDPKYSITEISYLLGFAEPSSFARSFKRWTGNSPSQSRNHKS